MSERRFTPGPWGYGIAYSHPKVEVPIDYQSGAYNDNPCIYSKATDEDIVGCDEYHVFGKPEDVQLMLAAPALYDALESSLGLVVCWATHYGVQILGRNHNHPEHDALIEQIKAALAKARGEA